VNIPTGKSRRIGSDSVNSGRIVVNLYHGAKVGVEVCAYTSAYVPTLIQMSPDVTRPMSNPKSVHLLGVRPAE
jgi:hypothetical protein